MNNLKRSKILEVANGLTCSDKTQQTLILRYLERHGIRLQEPLMRLQQLEAVVSKD